MRRTSVLWSARSNALDFSDSSTRSNLDGWRILWISSRKSCPHLPSKCPMARCARLVKALHVAEKLTLKATRPSARASNIYRHQLPRRAKRQNMDCARDDLLTGSMLAGDQDIRVRWSEASDGFQHGDHGRRRGNEIGRPGQGGASARWSSTWAPRMESSRSFSGPR